jgi:hypothetical protein
MNADDAAGHQIELELLEALPEEVDAGCDFILVVRVAAPPGVSLEHAPFTVGSAGDVRLRGELPDFGGETGDVVKIVVSAPPEIGGFDWTFAIPEHERDGKRSREASLAFAFRTRPHVTSLAVWDCPSPVVIGEPFSLKVGAQCGAACSALPGAEVEICDAAGAVMARVRLGSEPWPDTSALYWAQAAVSAPSTPGLQQWTARLSSAPLRLPHAAATFAFSTMCAWRRSTP